MRTEESEKDEQETQDVGITLITFDICKKAIPIFINMDCSNGFYDGPKDTLTACICCLRQAWFSMVQEQLPCWFLCESDDWWRRIVYLWYPEIFAHWLVLVWSFLHDRGIGVTRTSNLWFPQTIAYGLVLMLESLLEACLHFWMFFCAFSEGRNHVLAATTDTFYQCMW